MISTEPGIDSMPGRSARKISTSGLSDVSSERQKATSSARTAA